MSISFKSPYTEPKPLIIPSDKKLYNNIPMNLTNETPNLETAYLELRRRLYQKLFQANFPSLNPSFLIFF